MTPHIPLHTHSHYSLLQALPKIHELVAKAKEAGMKAIALTDNGNLYGALEFYKECKKAGIKPILGVDGYLAIRTRHDKQSGIDNKRHRLILLAKNNQGYRNLIKLVTLSHLEGFYYKPRMDRELLEAHSEGLIAIMPALGGEITAALRVGDKEKAANTADWYRKLFGNENFFLEITRHDEMDGNKQVVEDIVSFSNETKIPLVAGNEVYYLEKDEKKARTTLLSVQNGGEQRGGFGDDGDFHFLDNKEIEKRFSKWPDAISNTQKIAGMCDLSLALGKWNFPKFEIAGGKSADDELREEVFAGFGKRAIEKTTGVIERVEYELKVIKDKGYAPYFLVVSDLLDFAHSKKILTTIRGSVAGSLVTYLAGITNVNPIEYKLPFERFLNPERPSAPDIDMDYADNRRDEMIEYAKSKYGADKVAQIGTFGTMMARGSVRDVARALGYEYGTGDKIAKLIPFGSQGFPMSIERGMEMAPELKALYKQDKDVKAIIDMAMKIEGCARHISVHAAGVVIAPTPLTDFVPLQFDPKGEGKIITQYDMHAVEDAGLLKFDFLGIRNLSILADAVERVKQQENVDIDIENIPLDDKKTFEMLAKGETIGLFQLNGAGMTRYLKDLRPSTIHDINAMVALYRPGPMDLIPLFLENKKNPKKVKYLHPDLQSILEETYGVLVYQEQVMEIANKLAGYSMSKADNLRMAMGKKKKELMKKEKEKFLEGCVNNGYKKSLAEKIFNFIEKFAAYGFNKPHSASYGLIAYWTAYMKANFPVEFMTALLSAELQGMAGPMREIKMAQALEECRRMEIPVLPPDINKSKLNFSIEGKSTSNVARAIRFGLSAIKNVGAAAINAILTPLKDGPYSSFKDFIYRVDLRRVNKRTVESLIKAGAFKQFANRATLLSNYPKIVKEISDSKVETEKGQFSLFGQENASLKILDNFTPVEDFDEDEILQMEKEVIGFLISKNPLLKFGNLIRKKITKKIGDINQEDVDKTHILAGIVSGKKIIKTKKDSYEMAFINFFDETGSIECVVFPKLFIRLKEILAINRVILLKGKINDRDGRLSVLIDNAVDLDKISEY